MTIYNYLVANFAAYTFAPPILVTPLGALSVIIGCVLPYTHFLHLAYILSVAPSLPPSF